MNQTRVLFVLAALGGLILALSLASLAAGKVWVSPLGIFSGDDAAPYFIIAELRLPRTLLAIVVGGVLGLSGAVLQGYLRNPLADPAVLGVSACAAFGAVLSIWLGISAKAAWVLPACAMVAAIAGTALLYMLAVETNRVATFILAGIILNSLASALTSFAISLAPSPFATAEIINWMMGALTDRSMNDLVLILPFAALGCALLLTTGRALDGLSLGEQTARTLGLNLTAIHRRVLLGVGISVGATVAVTGIVGFVGLVVPHLLRPFVGARPGALLVPSMLGGSALVLAADTLVRVLPGGTEVKLGIVMALLGAPFFLFLLLRMRSQLA
ncbi:FecCD family ABC transporter permease [Pedomonas mirosovicensis]|uniref:FecCD family ABC transporter permease n=1 Tax=Pedomonas mirosovicensis TaxID=2908641 RepID=UPI002167C35A|nr:iron ABC transporter permease [Pedomonas mirosovicensis]MCH8685723.1 iron ABC transporter permease [Pedomonas mirosovicensis]